MVRAVQGVFIPSSKQRMLSLAQTLAQYPSFNSKSSMLEQIWNFEQLVGLYESSSGNVYPGDLKAATILRCSPARVREYLQLSLKEESTYSDIHEALLAYERVTKGYTSEQLLKQVQSNPDSEATPMEVDRIYKGGKDSGKNKGKKGGKDRGKGFDAFPWSFGRGRGKSGGRGKSKGRERVKERKEVVRKEKESPPKEVARMVDVGIVEIRDTGQRIVHMHELIR